MMTIRGNVLFDEFIRRCKENNSITYGGLLAGFRILIPMIQSFVNVRHILVDEVQDIDPLQWYIINDMVEIFRCGSVCGGRYRPEHIFIPRRRP